jgi:hypothetical protein
MAMKLMALVRQEVIDYLSANIIAKLDNIDARFGDFELEDIANFYKSDASVNSVTTFPIIIVQADETEVKRWDAYEHTDALHRLFIDVLVQDTNVEQLEQRVERYVLAIWELLLDGMVANEVSHLDGEAPRFVYLSTFTVPSGEYLSGGRVTVRLRKAETM